MAERTLAHRRLRRRLRGRTRALLALVLAGVLVVALGWLVAFSPYLTAERVRVRDDGALSVQRVRRVAQVPVGTPLARVDLGAVQARVEGISSVEGVEVSRSWPHTVEIAVTERTPVALVDTGSGRRAVDAGGVLFPVPTGVGRLPVIHADATTDTVSLREAAHVAAALPASLDGRVDHLQLRSADDIRLVLRDGRTIVWGSAADSATKARVVALLLRGRHGKVSQVDVSVPGRPTTR
ncbi:MAG: cell division protein FtsQ/DivIB [Marmoricola sp.]